MKLFFLLLIGTAALVYGQSISEPTPGTTWEAGTAYTVRWQPLNDTGVNPDDGNKTKPNGTLSIDLPSDEGWTQHVNVDDGAAQIRIPEDALGTANLTLTMDTNTTSNVSGIEIKKAANDTIP
ncbi:hypothetical protein [Absidia glauca]|uniref:Uncharacterized protein n=1 Tax=Absidia glauca TaxID=4829 RepID=A0A168T0N9_ABSGL|nr:hypothetical protein [Absidia glauca]